MRGLVLFGFIKSRHFMKQSLLLVFCLLHWKPRVDKTSQKDKRRIHQKPPVNPQVKPIISNILKKIDTLAA